MPSYGQEKWSQLFRSALLELEHSLLTRRIAEARTEIEKRIAALRDMPGIHDEECQAIEECPQQFALPGARRGKVPSRSTT